MQISFVFLTLVYLEPSGFTEAKAKKPRIYAMTWPLQGTHAINVKKKL